MTDRNEPPTYCTADEVAQTLDLPDPTPGADAYGMMTFSNMSHPSLEQVNRMIRANEDIIDRRLRRTWRENKVKDRIYTVNGYWHDQNGWRSEYYNQGGNFVQLHEHICEWDPEKGDRLQIRRRMNTWVDFTELEYETIQEDGRQEPIGLNMPMFWFDYTFGKLYIRTKFFHQGANSLRISYRYGEPIEDMPDAINRLCCLMTASQVINMQVFNIKVGAGGDISGIKDSLIRTWQDEMNQIWSSYLKIGKVRSLYR